MLKLLPQIDHQHIVGETALPTGFPSSERDKKLLLLFFYFVKTPVDLREMASCVEGMYQV